MSGENKATCFPDIANLFRDCPSLSLDKFILNHIITPAAQTLPGVMINDMPKSIRISANALRNNEPNGHGYNDPMAMKIKALDYNYPLID